MKLNRPVLLVKVVRVRLVCGSVMRISAPTSTAPCGSVTWPDTMPEDADCAPACAAPKTSNARPLNKHAESIRTRESPSVDVWFMMHPNPTDPQGQRG